MGLDPSDGIFGNLKLLKCSPLKRRFARRQCLEHNHVGICATSPAPALIDHELGKR
jgi:hypothetical protein